MASMLHGRSHNFATRMIALTMFFIIATGCSTIPEALVHENLSMISVEDVQQEPDNYKGQRVRWGGVITQIINNKDDTWVEVLALQLSSNGRPLSNRLNNQGRFIAKLDQFLDPEVYQAGYSITIIGTVTDNIDGKIGEYLYQFPVITVQGHHLWPKMTSRAYRYISPGYWYYGHHPFWNFGYSYYGFGVRFHYDYYPYYPIYGHLNRHSAPLIKSMPGVFTSGVQPDWPLNKNLFVLSNHSSSRALALRMKFRNDTSGEHYRGKQFSQTHNTPMSHSRTNSSEHSRPIFTGQPSQRRTTTHRKAREK